LIRSLLEFDSSRAGVNIDWRSKLDNQRGAVLASEIKNNNSVIARWVFQAYLAQADNIKLAYVSRISQKDRFRHELLALQDVEPYELAVQMNLDTANGFGILKALFDLFARTQNSVVIVRDPTKPMLRLYEVSN
jgi:translation initiation factor 3 subunit D